VVSFQTAGTCCTVDANQAGNANYNGGTPGPADLHGGQGRPDGELHLDGPGHGAVVGGATYTPTATASSGLAVAITVDARLVLGVRSPPGWSASTGRHLRPRRQPGRQRQLQRRPQVQQSFTVGKAAQTVTFTSTAPAGAPHGGRGHLHPTATASSGLTVAITVDASSSVCSITAAW
jgi:hypothetical protein